MNPYNSNSCNSKNLNRTNSSVLSEFTSKPLQENSFNSNSHNSKNHLNRTNFCVPWTYFSSCNSNFGFGVQFFHHSIFYCSKFKCFNSNAIMLFFSLCNTLHREDTSPAYFFSKFGRNNLNSYNSKTHVIRTNFESPWGFELWVQL